MGLMLNEVRKEIERLKALEAQLEETEIRDFEIEYLVEYYDKRRNKSYLRKKIKIIKAANYHEACEIFRSKTIYDEIVCVGEA